jgi:signal transduction histidine kinase
MVGMSHEEKGRILVVDDNDLNVEMLCMRLRRSGYEPHGVLSGRAALDALGRDAYDLVVLDIMMPEMDGIEVLGEIRKRYSLTELPVIMATAKTESADMVKAFEAGANDYVTKPIDLWVLLARIRTHLQLRRLVREKDEFLAIASHDLKNPLNNIYGYAKLLQTMGKLGEPMSDEMRDMLERIVRQSQVMLRIIVDYLDLHALEEGQLTLAREPVDLNQLVEECVKEHYGAAAQKELTIEFAPLAGPAIVNVDADRIHQVLHNLFSNALKFSSRGTTLQARVERPAADTVKFSVRDGGPGLTPDDLRLVFQKFSRLSARATGGEKSSSIGLSIARRLVDMHGGTIGCENHPEGGAVFWFVLPAHQPVASEAAD